MTTSTELAARYWSGDLDCHRAAQEMWATGRYLADDDPLMERIFGLDAELVGIGEELHRRAAHWSTFQVGQLADDIDGASPEVAEKIRAAAVLRVLTTDTYIEASEALQPGAELPAVGVYAEMD